MFSSQGREIIMRNNHNMFTRKNNNKPSSDSDIFNNRLKELKTPLEGEEEAPPELSEFSSEPLPVPEKLKKRISEPQGNEPMSAPPRASTMQSQADDASLETNQRPRETVIGNDLIIAGSVVSDGVIRLEGAVHGDLHCSALVVETDGSVAGNVKAGTVNVHGRVEGTIYGDNVMLHSSAFVEGDIYHQGIGIEMGTHYDGRLQWVDAQEASAPLVNDYLEAAE